MEECFGCKYPGEVYHTQECPHLDEASRAWHMGRKQQPTRLDLADYGDMYMMAKAAVGIFTRVEIDPEHVIALIDEITQLQFLEAHNQSTTVS